MTLIEEIRYRRFLDRPRGGAGPGDVAFFSAFPDAQTTQTVTDFFVKQGLFTGPIAYAITHPNTVHLHGIEDPTLYLDHLHTWQQGDGQHASLAPRLERLTTFLKQRQQVLYSKELQGFLQRHQEYETGTRSLTEYLADLTALAKRHGISPQRPRTGLPDAPG